MEYSIEYNSSRRNLFLRACLSWENRYSLREMDQKLKNGGTIGYESYSYLNTYLEFVFCQSKVRRLYGRLLAASRAVQSHSGESPG